ncbi:MAG: putative toxin-antitoxin system toxin component, PIN family [Candidatus Binatia bacterium]
MKVFFDTNVYIAEALLGEAAEALLSATAKASWRVFVSHYLLNEIERVLVDDLSFSPRLAQLTRQRCSRRGSHVPDRLSRHAVPDDPTDSPILRAALDAGTDYLVTNDTHLLDLNPYEGLRIISMTDYYQLLIHEGLIS